MVEMFPDSQMTYLVGIDHRVDFAREIVGATADPTASERERAAELKRVVFDALVVAIEHGVPKSQCVLWADQDIGEGVLLRARAMSLATAASAEHPVDSNSELGDPTKSWDAVTRLDATYMAARVQYSPAGVIEVRERQQVVLQRMSQMCREGGRKLVLEVTPRPTSVQIDEFGDEESARTVSLLETIQQLQDAGVDPAVWAYEPPRDRNAAATIAAQAYVDDRTAVSVLFIVANEPDPGNSSSQPGAVEKSVIRLAARTTGVGGLLVGPQAYFNDLVQFDQGNIDRDDAVASIATRFEELWSLYSGARATSDIV